MSRPHYRVYKSSGFDPFEVRPDESSWTKCKVCGFTLNGDRTGEPERFSGLSLVTTGTVYFPTTPGVEGLATKNLTVESVVGSGCNFCGSGAWASAHGPEGARL